MTIDGPSKVKMDCKECSEGYKITYIPMAPGNYLISIKYGGPYHIVGSPFKAKITGRSLTTVSLLFYCNRCFLTCIVGELYKLKCMLESHHVGLP